MESKEASSAKRGCWRIRCFACVDVHNVPALLALDIAAPVKLALTLVHPDYSLGVISPATAHDVTAIRPQ